MGIKPAGHAHVKAYGDVLPEWVTFSLKILRHGSHFGQNILRHVRRGPISLEITKKIVKPAVFEVENPSEMGPVCKISRGKKNRKKPRQKIIRVPPPGIKGVAYSIRNYGLAFGHCDLSYCLIVTLLSSRIRYF